MAPDAAALSELAPVFIMGSHRSGTTWLYQLLAETRGFDYLTAYHVIRYDLLPEPAETQSMEETYREFLVTLGLYQELSATFERLQLNRRSFDEVEISPSTPEEYGFILSNGGTSPHITPRNLPLFHQLCSRLRTPGSNKPLLLKNPYDYANFRYIKKALPRARFVFIHRHPERVLHSFLNALRLLLQEKDSYVALLSRAYTQLFEDSGRTRLQLSRLLVTRRLDFGVRLAAVALAASHRYYLKNLPALDPSDYLSIRYEDLCERPEEMLGQILRFVGVELPAELASTRPRPRTGALLPEIERRRNEIAWLMRPYMQLQRYS
jgi:hypothetical protein